MTAAELDFSPPDGLLEVARTLESRGHQAWAVGGAVRDQLLGGGRADWDIATDARPEEVQSVFRRTVPVGVEHGTVGVLASDDVMYEVTTFRQDVETDGRHAVVEFSESIEEDLARRDFTINALAWRPETEELRDPYGGGRDLEARVLRAVGDPQRRFQEDYLRVLRGLRFAGRFRMEIEPATEEALRESAGLTGDLSEERIQEELRKVLRDPQPSEALRLYGEFGVLEVWYPEVARAAERDPRWELHLAAVDAVARTRPLVRLARWLVPVGEDGEERSERGGEILLRLKFSNRAVERVLHLLQHYEPLPGPTDSDAELRSWMAEVGRDHLRDVLRMHIAAARSTGGEEQARFLTFLWRRIHEQLLSHPPLELSDLAVNGRDLLEQGVEEGPYLGVLLEELHAQALENPRINNREDLLELAEELIEVGYLRGPEEGEDPAAGVPGGPETGG